VTQNKVMTKPPRVSVVMAAYNAALHLAEAAESVLAQTMPDLELIIVDDGSVDATPQVIAELAARDSRVVTLRQENGGIGAAMNAALRLARGNHVAILDSDDVMLPERLAIQAAYLDAHPDVAAVGSQWFTMDVAGRMAGIDRHPTEPEATWMLMFAYFALHHPTVMARRALLHACGGYLTTQRLGAPDYALFANLAHAGHRFASLPLTLTRWRLNPVGVTRGKAREQTEDAVAIRDAAFSRLFDHAPDEAKAVAKALVRTFPEGTWFDEKVNRVLPNPAPSPALTLWREMATRGEVPRLEVAAVDWLHDEATHAGPLAEELVQAGLAWLAALTRAKAGGDAPALISGFVAEMSPPNSTCPLSVLVPTQRDDADLLDRVDAALGALPAGSEILVFATDGRDVAIDLPAVSQVRLVGTADTRNPWQAAFKAAGGRYIAWLEAGQRHHQHFLVQGIGQLDAHPDEALVYAPSDIFYADVLDARGNPVRDPATEPRWSQETLLGRDRALLGCMLHRREALLDVPVDLREAGEVAGWALARCLLTRHRPVLLDMRNSHTLPALSLGNNILPTMARRLIAWYLDFALGRVPSPYAWPSLDPADASRRLHFAGRLAQTGVQPLHPGNMQLLLDFACRFATLPVIDPLFCAALLSNRRAALLTLRQHRPSQVPFALAYSVGNRAIRKLARRLRVTPTRESLPV
jgi:hypothetical protein